MHSVRLFPIPVADLAKMNERLAAFFVADIFKPAIKIEGVRIGAVLTAFCFFELIITLTTIRMVIEKRRLAPVSEIMIICHISHFEGVGGGGILFRMHSMQRLIFSEVIRIWAVFVEDRCF